MARARLLTDTSILIDHLRKTQKDRTIFYQLSSQYDFTISAITEFEFRVGSSPNNRAFIDFLLNRLPVLPLDSACVRVAVEISQELKISNQMISLPDILIAATAVTHKLPLLTLNQKHFSRIAKLTLHT